MYSHESSVSSFAYQLEIDQALEDALRKFDGPEKQTEAHQNLKSQAARVDLLYSSGVVDKFITSAMRLQKVYPDISVYHTLPAKFEQPVEVVMCWNFSRRFCNKPTGLVAFVDDITAGIEDDHNEILDVKRANMRIGSLSITDRDLLDQLDTRMGKGLHKRPFEANKKQIMVPRKVRGFMDDLRVWCKEPKVLVYDSLRAKP